MEAFISNCEYDGLLVVGNHNDAELLKANMTRLLPRRFTGAILMDGSVSKEVYRDMKDRCIVITDEQWLRAVDFKLDDKYKLYNPDYKGIGLMMLRRVSCKRIYEQAAGRVGRQNEHCGRHQFAKERYNT